MIKSLLGICLLVCSVVHLTGQQDLRNRIKERLASKEVWIDTYTGLLDGCHTIEIAVGHDADGEAGIVRLPSSGLTLDMDFIVHNESYVELVKLTTYGDTLYRLAMDCKGVECTGLWQTPSDREALSIHVYESQNAINCERMHYIQIYEDVDSEVSYQIKRRDNSIALYTIDSTYSGECIDPKCSRISFDTVYIDGQVHQKAYYMRNARQSTLLLESSEAAKTIRITPQRKLSYICESFIDHNQRYSIQLPKIENTELLAYCRKKLMLPSLSNINRSDESMNDSNQYETISYTWCDITYFDNNIVSGYLNLQTNDSETVKEVAFIYDLEKQQEINPRKAFSSRIKRLVNTATYPLLVMNSEGFVFSSVFDPIYGTKTKAIPYGAAAKFVRDKALKKYVK